MRVTLPENVVRKIERVAKKRQERRGKDVKERAYHPKRTSYDIDKIGLAGEVALCHALGREHPRFSAKEMIDDGTDILLDGKTVQIKTRFDAKYPELIFQDVSQFKTEIAVLILKISRHVYEVAGWITKEEFVERSTLKSLPRRNRGSNSVYFVVVQHVKAKNLNPIADLTKFD